MEFWTDIRVLSALSLLLVALGVLIYYLRNRDNPYSKIGGKPSSEINVVIYSPEKMVIGIEKGLYGKDGLWFRGQLIPVTSEMIEAGTKLQVSLKKVGSTYVPMKITHLSIDNGDEARIIADIIPKDKILMFNAGFERTFMMRLRSIVEKYNDPIQQFLGNSAVFMIATILILGSVVLVGNWILDASKVCAVTQQAQNITEAAGVLGGLIK